MARSIGFRQFALRARQISEIVERNITRQSREVLLFGDAQLVKLTRVDTGKARASTILTVGVPANQDVEPPVPGDGGASAAFAAAQAAAAVATYDPLSGLPAFITQTTTYSPILDARSNIQGGPGMTGPTAAAMREFIARRFSVLRGV